MAEFIDNWGFWVWVIGAFFTFVGIVALGGEKILDEDLIGLIFMPAIWPLLIVAAIFGGALFLVVGLAIGLGLFIRGATTGDWTKLKKKNR